MTDGLHQREKTKFETNQQEFFKWWKDVRAIVKNRKSDEVVEQTNP